MVDEGGQDFSAQVWRGGKNVVRDYRGGACFECERFSEFHRPPAVNNDHSLIAHHLTALDYTNLLRGGRVLNYNNIEKRQEPAGMLKCCWRLLFNKRRTCKTVTIGYTCMFNPRTVFWGPFGP